MCGPIRVAPSRISSPESNTTTLRQPVLGPAFSNGSKRIPGSVSSGESHQRYSRLGRFSDLETERTLDVISELGEFRISLHENFRNNWTRVVSGAAAGIYKFPNSVILMFLDNGSSFPNGFVPPRISMSSFRTSADEFFLFHFLRHGTPPFWICCSLRDSPIHPSWEVHARVNAV